MLFLSKNSISVIESYYFTCLIAIHFSFLRVLYLKWENGSRVGSICPSICHLLPFFSDRSVELLNKLKLLRSEVCNMIFPWLYKRFNIENKTRQDSFMSFSKPQNTPRSCHLKIIKFETRSFRNKSETLSHLLSLSIKN